LVRERMRADPRSKALFEALEQLLLRARGKRKALRAEQLVSGANNCGAPDPLIEELDIEASKDAILLLFREGNFASFQKGDHGSCLGRRNAFAQGLALELVALREHLEGLSCGIAERRVNEVEV
jgi:hypothetical protein